MKIYQHTAETNYELLYNSDLGEGICVSHPGMSHVYLTYAAKAHEP